MRMKCWVTELMILSQSSGGVKSVKQNRIFPRERRRDDARRTTSSLIFQQQDTLCSHQIEFPPSRSAARRRLNKILCQTCNWMEFTYKIEEDEFNKLLHIWSNKAIFITLKHRLNDTYGLSWHRIIV